MNNVPEIFRSYIAGKAQLSEAEMERILTLGFVRKVKKKQFILQEGDVCWHNCFVASGCFRLYRVSEDGNEHIIRFAVENWWISDRESYHTGQPSHCYIEALEDSEVMMWTKDNLDLLMKEIPAIGEFVNALLARSFHASQNRIYSAISASAEDKYVEFITAYPNIFNRVPLHMIASYLGVTRITLSRVRNQYGHK